MFYCVWGGGVLRSSQGEGSRRQTPYMAGFHSLEIPSVCLLAIVTHLCRVALYGTFASARYDSLAHAT